MAEEKAYFWSADDEPFVCGRDDEIYEDNDLRTDKYNNKYNTTPEETKRGVCPRCHADIMESDEISWLHHKTDARHDYDSVLCPKCTEEVDLDYIADLGIEVEYNVSAEEIDPDLNYDFVYDSRYDPCDDEEDDWMMFWDR